ncbi:MAG: DUF4340 domain-containing protein [Flavobacteriales bacterium]
MRNLILGVVLLVILSVVAFMMFYKNDGSTLRKELSDFAYADTANITKIVLTDESGNRVELRKTATHWTVNSDHKARPDGIENLLTTIKKLSVKSPVSQSAMQTTLKMIIANHIEVEIFADGNKPVKSYYVGGPDRDHTGTVMMMKESSRPFIVHIEGFHGFLSPRYFTNELEWRSREIFELAPDQIASIQMTYHTKPENNWRYENKGDGNIVIDRGAQLNTPAKFDTLMLNAYLANYKMIHYESYEETKPQEYIDSVLATQPVFSLNLVTADGKSRSVNGFKKPLKEGYDMEGNPIEFDADRLYVWVDSSGFYTAQYAIFDKLTKGVYFFK